MRPSSAKAKGRRLQNWVAERVRAVFSLPQEDVKPAVMGESGMDLHLSAAAARVFPFSIECKNQEALNVWAALQQAEANEARGLPALLLFKRNHTKVYAALDFEVLLDILRRLDESGTTYAPRSPLDR